MFIACHNYALKVQQQTRKCGKERFNTNSEHLQNCNIVSTKVATFSGITTTTSIYNNPNWVTQVGRPT